MSDKEDIIDVEVVDDENTSLPKKGFAWHTARLCHLIGILLGISQVVYSLWIWSNPVTFNSEFSYFLKVEILMFISLYIAITIYKQLQYDVDDTTDATMGRCGITLIVFCILWYVNKDITPLSYAWIPWTFIGVFIFGGIPFKTDKG